MFSADETSNAVSGRDRLATIVSDPSTPRETAANQHRSHERTELRDSPVFETNHLCAGEWRAARDIFIRQTLPCHTNQGGLRANFQEQLIALVREEFPSPPGTGLPDAYERTSRMLLQFCHPYQFDQSNWIQCQSLVLNTECRLRLFQTHPGWVPSKVNEMHGKRPDVLALIPSLQNHPGSPEWRIGTPEITMF